jgi:hypothetical protein
MTPYLKLTDASNNVYSFPKSFFIGPDPAALRSDIRELLYGHGGIQVGDQFVRSRKILIQGALQADSGGAFDMAYRALVNALVKGGKLTIVTDVTARYLDVTLDNIDSEWEYYPQYKKVDITLDAAFPLWQDASLTTDVSVMTGSGGFNIDTHLSDHIVMPVIEFVANRGANVPTITLVNTTDNGMSIIYNNALFVIGDTVIMDSIAGTIKRNSVSEMIPFVSGTFLRLQPMVNAFAYTGAAVTINVKYRKVYL